MPTVHLKAIAPTNPVLIDKAKVSGGIEAQLQKFALEVHTNMARYPAQRPTVRSYKRKGASGLGGGWKIRPYADGQIEVFNNVSYSVYVQGPRRGSKEDRGIGTRQALVMKKKGWQNITSVSGTAWRKRKLAVYSILTSGGRNDRRRG